MTEPLCFHLCEVSRWNYSHFWSDAKLQSARGDQDELQPIRKYEQDYDDSLASPFPWCNSSWSSKHDFIARFENIFLLSRLFWRIMCSECCVSHPQIALASLGFVLWLGDSSFDQTSALDILYLCIFVDHFYWEQIISFSRKCVIHLTSALLPTKLPLTHQMFAIRYTHRHTHMCTHKLVPLFRTAVRFINIKCWRSFTDKLSDNQDPILCVDLLLWIIKLCSHFMFSNLLVCTFYWSVK